MLLGDLFGDEKGWLAGWLVEVGIRSDWTGLDWTGLDGLFDIDDRTNEG